MRLPVISSIQSWLEPPVFAEDEKKTHRARLLNAIFIAVFVFMVFMLPFVLLSEQFPRAIKIVDVCIFVSCLLMRYFLFKGRVKEVSFWFTVSGFILITAAIASLGTILTPTTVSYLFMVITSGFLFGMKGIILSSAASSLLVGGLIISINTGFIPQRTYTIDFIYWIIYVLFFGLIGSLTHFLIQTTLKALERSNKEIAERIHAEGKLRASEVRFRYLFEQTHDAVFMIDLVGRYLAVNQRAADMLGYSVSDIMALSLTDISARIDQTLDIAERLLAGEHIPHHESLMRKKDGSVLPVEMYLELVRDEHGAPQFVQIVARDISERKQAENELKSANEQLNTHIAEIEQLQVELREQAIRDPLTGLYNRRYLSEILKREVAHAEKGKTNLSIIIADIDHFKQINDLHGHQAGDCFLVEIARLTKSLVRASDLIFRYGGEEFIFVLPDSAVDAAQKRAEEIRQRIETFVLQYNGKELTSTISLGVACFPGHGSDAEELTIKADQAMYHAKQTGRNRVVVWDEEQRS